MCLCVMLEHKGAMYKRRNVWMYKGRLTILVARIPAPSLEREACWGW